MPCDRPQGRGPVICEESGADRLGEGADLVAGDGFVFQQGGGEPVEGVAVAGEQVPGPGFGAGEQGGDFLVDQPLGALGIAAWCAESRVAGGRVAVAER